MKWGGGCLTARLVFILKDCTNAFVYAQTISKRMEKEAATRVGSREQEGSVGDSSLYFTPVSV